MTMTSGAKGLLMVASLYVVLLSVLACAHADTLVVDDDPGPWRDHATVQDAIDAASPGDTVRVFAGTYVENIEIKKRLSVQGNGTDDTVLDGNGTGNVVRLAADSISLSGFQIRNGGSDGAGVRVDSGSKSYPPGTHNDVVEGNLVWRNAGHGIEAYISDMHEFRDNEIRDNGGDGIRLERSGDIGVLGNVIGNNTVGIRLLQSDYDYVRGNEITENRGVGILFEEDSDASDVTNNTIRGNADYGICFLNGSGSNEVYFNDMVLNGGAGSQGHDSESDDTNQWFSEWGGNGWSDYNGTDADRDGIGDTWYAIDGDGGRYDKKPLVEVPNILPNASILTISPFPSVEGQDVTFSGNGTDEDGGVTRYVWSSDADGEFYNGTSNTTVFGGLSRGEHNITFRCQDDRGGWSGPDVTSFEVLRDPNATNLRPTANIVQVGPDPAPSDEDISFLGSGVDADGEVRRVLWNSSLDGALYSGPPGWSFTSALSAGLHNISLSVRDDDGRWGRADWTFITVYPIANVSNAWPEATIESIGPDPAREGDDVTFTAGADDPDGTVGRLVWISSSDGLLYDGADLSFTTAALSVGTHSVQLRAMDDLGAWSNATTASVTVIERENRGPEAEILGISPNPSYPDEVVTFTAKGSDPDGEIVNYYWQSDIAGLLYDGPDASFQRSALPLGTHTVTLTVEDDEGAFSDPVTATLVVRIRPTTDGEGEEDAGGPIDLLLGILTDPMILLPLALVIAVIAVAAGLGARSRRRRRAEEEAAARAAAEAAARQAPPPEEAFKRPGPGAGAAEERRPTAGGSMPPPEEDTGVEWQAGMDPSQVPRGGREVFEKYDREYKRSVFGRSDEEAVTRGPVRSVPEEMRRGPPIAYDAEGRPVYAPRRGEPGYDEYMALQEAARALREAEEEREARRRGLEYRAGGKEYRTHAEPVRVPKRMKRPTCPDCRAPIEKGARFCPACGKYFG